jgi:agmatine deiminase
MPDDTKTLPCPRDKGFRMPAEWEPHEATWLSWPHHRHDWPGKFSVIQWVYAEIVRHLHRSERVRIVVRDERTMANARRVLSENGIDLTLADFYRHPTNRSWIRDFGPIFIKDDRGRVAMTDWGFNGWAKYPNWENDNAIPSRLESDLGLQRWTPSVNGKHVVLEGGSIDANGQGLLLTTEECLLDAVQARNPSLDRQQLEEAFAAYLGTKKVLWLGRGIAGDDTHGHVDDLARFVNPTTIVTVVEEVAADPNYVPTQENLDRLRSMRNLDDQPFEIVTLPMPEPVVFRGQRLPASYANFYIANDRVLVPTFNDPADRRALGILAQLFPDRQTVGIHCVDLVWGLGTIHCMTQQQPVGSGQ